MKTIRLFSGGKEVQSWQAKNYTRLYDNMITFFDENHHLVEICGTFSIEWDEQDVTVPGLED